MTNFSSTKLEDSRTMNTIHITVAIIGITANSFVLFIVKRNSSMHTAVNFLLVNVAGSDILLLVGSFIYAATDLQQDFKPHIKRVLHCKIMPTVSEFGFCSSVFTLTLLSLQNYLGLVIPVNKSLEFNRKNAKYVILVVWTTSLLLQIPLMLYLAYDPSIDCCNLEMSVNGKTIHTVCLSLIARFIPITIICFCYSKILYGIYISKTILSENTAPNGKDPEKRKLVRASLLITVVTIICYVPAEVLFNVAISCRSDCSYTRHLIEIAFVFYAVKGTVNPFLYAFQSSNYRAALKALLCHCRKSNMLTRVSPRCVDNNEAISFP